MIFTRRLLWMMLLWISVIVHAETKSETPFLGITHITRTEDSPRHVSIHVVMIDLTAPGLSFKLTAPAGMRETLRQTTLEFLRQERAQVAVNSHFFLPFPSADSDAFLIGLAASNGTVFSAFETPVQSYAIVSDAPAINIDDSNHASIVHKNAESVDGLQVAEDLQLYNAFSGSAQIITDGVVTIPQYKDEDNSDGLLTLGGPANYSNLNSWYNLTNARTSIGISEDGQTLILFTVDRAAGSLGMTVGEVATMMHEDYGAFQALNMDGGGSTTLAMQDPITNAGFIANVSSDNVNGRSVASNLAVFAAPIPDRERRR